MRNCSLMPLEAAILTHPLNLVARLSFRFSCSIIIQCVGKQGGEGHAEIERESAAMLCAFLHISFGYRFRTTRSNGELARAAGYCSSFGFDA
jgi:hypothetical protein